MDSLKRSACIKKTTVVDPYANSIKLNPGLGLNSIITSSEEDLKLKAVVQIVKNKFEMDCESEIEDHQKACLETLNKINEKKNKEGFNIVIEVNNMKWEERNLMELMFTEKGGKSIYVYNP